jgi:hypothetical protein
MPKRLYESLHHTSQGILAKWRYPRSLFSCGINYIYSRVPIRSPPSIHPREPKSLLAEYLKTQDNHALHSIK